MQKNQKLWLLALAYRFLWMKGTLQIIQTSDDKFNLCLNCNKLVGLFQSTVLRKILYPYLSSERKNVLINQ